MIRALREVVAWLAGRRIVFRVEGASMAPGLVAGDRVIVDPRTGGGRDPRPGEVVVALHPWRRDVVLVKRVARVEADGSVFLLGDHPAASTDSRTLGAVPAALVVGRVSWPVVDPPRPRPA